MGISATGPAPEGMPEFDQSITVNELLESVAQSDRDESLAAYRRYISVAELFMRCCDQDPSQDERVFDAYTNTAARLSAVRRVGQRSSEATVGVALALVWRIPLVGLCLRDGIITDWQFKLLVSRTDLIEGTEYAHEVDAEIAAELRRNGVWSYERLKGMADLIIFGHDPEAVRRARQAAEDDRRVWTSAKGDGMSEFGVIASAEEIILAGEAIDALARSVCKLDPRTMDQRRSDAVICRLQQRLFECGCEQEDCDAEMPEQDVSERQAQIVLNVICASENLEEDRPCDDESPDDDRPDDDRPADSNAPADSSGTGDEGADDEGADDAGDGGANDVAGATGSASSGAAGSGNRAARRGNGRGRPKMSRGRTSTRSGFLDGYGVISAAHVDQIARRSGLVIRYLNRDPEAPLPTYQPADKYRPSAALDTYVRVRDGYCTFPGCAKRAWRCQIDHVTEFDHDHPEDGGQTCACNTDLKCLFHHLLKTFGDWVDDIYIDEDGFTHVMYRTPEGLVFDSGGYGNERLFPELLNIRFKDPPPRKQSAVTGKNSGPGSGPLRRRPRTEEKHARRLYERKKNREDRARRQAESAAKLAGMPEMNRRIAETERAVAESVRIRLGDEPPF